MKTTTYLITVHGKTWECRTANFAKTFSEIPDNIREAFPDFAEIIDWQILRIENDRMHLRISDDITQEIHVKTTIMHRDWKNGEPCED